MATTPTTSASLSSVGGAPQKPIKLMDVWSDEAGIVSFISQQIQAITRIEEDPANQQAGFIRFKPAAKKKLDALSLTIKQATDRRLALQGTPVVGYGFSNYRR